MNVCFAALHKHMILLHGPAEMEALLPNISLIGCPTDAVVYMICRSSLSSPSCMNRYEPLHCHVSYL